MSSRRCSRGIISLLIVATVKLASAQSSDEARLAACQSVAPPASYAETAFLGERQFIEAGPVNFSYFAFGPLDESSSTQGPPMVMIAGQGATSSVWTPDLLRNLAQQREVIIFDNMGIGMSSYAGTDYSLSQYAQTTLDLFEALDLQQPDMLGWSFGGAIALQFATHYPDAIRRLILADTTAGGQGLIYSAVTRATLAETAKAIQAGQSIGPGVIFPDTPAGNAGLCRFLASLQDMPQDSATQAQALAQEDVLTTYFTDPGFDEVYSALGNITAPTLVLHGTQDAVIAIGNAFVLVEQIPDASLLQYADAGHAAILQHDDDAPNFINLFLDDPGLAANGAEAPAPDAQSSMSA